MLTGLICGIFHRLSTAAGHLAEHWRTAAGPHGLAESSQEQRSLLREEREGSPAGQDIGAAQLDVLW